MGKLSFVSINRADPSGRDKDEAAEALGETDSLQFIPPPDRHVWQHHTPRPGRHQATAPERQDLTENGDIIQVWL